jgi:hypothetical protein
VAQKVECLSGFGVFCFSSFQPFNIKDSRFGGAAESWLCVVCFPVDFSRSKVFIIVKDSLIRGPEAIK